MKTNLLLTIFTIAFHFYGEAQINFQRTYGEINDDSGRAIAETDNGEFVIAAMYNLIGTDYTAYPYIIRVNSYGDTIWKKKYDFLGNYSSISGVRSIIKTSDNNFVFLGYYAAGGGNYMLKINNVGDTLWFKNGISLGSGTYYKMVEDNSGNLVLVGEGYLAPPNCCTSIIKKIDPNGNTISSFSPNITCPTSSGCRLQEIFLDNDGNYLVSGDTPYPNTPKMRLTKIAENGTIIWNRYYLSVSASVRGITQSEDNGYLLVVQYWNVSDSTLVYKINNSGDLEWTRKYKTSNVEWQGSSIDKASDGYLISGYNGGSNSNIQLMKLGFDYNLVLSSEFGGSSSETMREIKSTNDGGIIIIGTTWSYGAGESDVFIIKTDHNGLVVGLNEIILQQNLSKISPNPFSTQAVVQTDKILNNATLTIYNTVGQQVKQVNSINGQAITIHRDNLPSGLYYVQLTQDNQTIATDKLVIAD